MFTSKPRLLPHKRGFNSNLLRDLVLGRGFFHYSAYIGTQQRYLKVHDTI